MNNERTNRVRIEIVSFVVVGWGGVTGDGDSNYIQIQSVTRRESRDVKLEVGKWQKVDVHLHNNCFLGIRVRSGFYSSETNLPICHYRHCGGSALCGHIPPINGLFLHILSRRAAIQYIYKKRPESSRFKCRA